MHIKTLLNRCHPIKPFVYGKAQFVKTKEGEQELEVAVKPRKNGQPLCSACGKPGSVYDRLGERRFGFVPVWGFAVFLVYAMRRVNCKIGRAHV